MPGRRHTVQARDVDRPCLAAGFTLMELIVVMTIIALMTATVVPIYQGTVTWARFDRATRTFVAYMKYAQERAITDMTEYRFYMNYDTGAYWLMRQAEDSEGDEDAFEQVDDSDGGHHVLPEKISLDGTEARNDRDRDAHYVAFYAGGACDYATVKLRTKEGRETIIKTKGRLGQLEVEQD